MAPAVQETHVDASRKTPATPNSNLSDTEDTTRVSDYARAIKQTEFGDDPAKDARRHRHKHHSRGCKREHEEDRHLKGEKHHQEASRLKTASSEFAPHQAVICSSDGVADFFEDRKGDQYNVMYGSVHRYEIPRYRTAGRQRVVGLGRMHKILQTSDGNARVLSEDHIDSIERLKAKSLLVGIVDKKTQVRVVPENANTQTRAAELQRDFLSLSPHGSRKRRRLEADKAFQVVPEGYSPRPDHG